MLYKNFNRCQEALLKQIIFLKNKISISGFSEIILQPLVEEKIKAKINYF